MRRSAQKLVASLALTGLITVGASLRSEAEILKLADVIRSAKVHHPKLIAQRQKLRAAQGKTLSARGIFDPTLKVNHKQTEYGDYPNRYTQAKLLQQTSLRGLALYAGYKRGQGKFASYQERPTEEGGEGHVGVQLPLLRGGAIDDNRASLWTAEIGELFALQEYRVQELELLAQVADAYWGWIASTKRLEVAKRLEELSQVRIDQIDTRVSAGYLPAIDRVDNQRSLYKRQGQRIKERRGVDKALLKLALYHRSKNGAPMPLLQLEPTPPAAVEREAFTARNKVGSDIEFALLTRPEIEFSDAEIEQTTIEQRVATNELLPEVSLYGELGHDFGRQYLDTENRLTFGLSFSLPLFVRKGRGLRIRADGRNQAAIATKAWVSDQIVNQVQDAHSQLQASLDQLKLAKLEVGLALQVEDAERERYRSGEVPLLSVNLRESASAEAQFRLIDAELSVRESENRLRAVTARGFNVK